MLIVGLTPWHMTWGGVRPQRARRTLDGARMSARELRVEPYPTFSKTSPAPRVLDVPSRESPFEPRLVGTVPECVSPLRHALDEDSPADGNVSRAGDGCGVVCVFEAAPMARPPPCILTI